MAHPEAAFRRSTVRPDEVIAVHDLGPILSSYRPDQPITQYVEVLDRHRDEAEALAATWRIVTYLHYRPRLVGSPVISGRDWQVQTAEGAMVACGEAPVEPGGWLDDARVAAWAAIAQVMLSRYEHEAAVEWDS